jgi:hypothetical protein
MECDRRYSELLQPSVMMPEEYWKKRKDDWMKINCYTNSGVVTPKANEIQRDELGQPQVKRPMGLAMPLNPDFELGLKVGKLPDEFVIKSNGFNTRYYQVRGMFGSTVYMQSYRTDGSIGSSPPMKISNEEFLKAYDVFLQQPK